jgi:hypothetical protein
MQQKDDAPMGAEKYFDEIIGTTSIVTHSYMTNPLD